MRPWLWKKPNKIDWVSDRTWSTLTAVPHPPLPTLIPTQPPNQPNLSIHVNKAKISKGLRDLGPFLDPKKIQGLPSSFGPGPLNRVLRQSVQQLVDASLDQKEMFGLLRQGDGKIIITACFEDKMQTVRYGWVVQLCSFCLLWLGVSKRRRIHFCLSFSCLLEVTEFLFFSKYLNLKKNSWFRQLELVPVKEIRPKKSLRVPSERKKSSFLRVTAIWLNWIWPLFTLKS